jgi:NAD(P)-dependent dehydrogenase (short-subunit alcohol dehydrogenase family)
MSCAIEAAAINRGSFLNGPAASAFRDEPDTPETRTLVPPGTEVPIKTSSFPAFMARQTFDVRGKTAFVTGAARGIGAETARRLHARGANVALVGLEPAELEKVAAGLGDRAAWFEADVTDLAGLQDVAAKVVERFGGIDIVLANAGVAPNGSVASVDPAVFDRTIEVNLLGVFRTVRATLPHVVAARGYVLIVSSASALVHTPLMAAYTASKAGAEAFGDALRAEVAHTGTKVGVAYFSFIDTDMVRNASKVAPLSEAIDAIERGITTRARTVVAPKSVRSMLYLRTLLQPLSELGLRRDKRFLETLRMAEAEESELTTQQPRG